MIFIPVWISNVILLIACVWSAIQHTLLRRANPVTNIQFFIMIFTIVMMLGVVFYNNVNPWLSLGFFLIAVVCLGVTFRQQRMMPPMKPFE
jgi:Ca2+/Na+ antiporter